MAGGFCTLGMALAYMLGSEFHASEALAGAYKLIVGAAFAFSFTMIIFSGAELFTGNIFYMTVGFLSKKVKLSQAFALLLFCYFSNIIGAVIIGILFASTGLMNGLIGGFIVNSTVTKMALPFGYAFSRGILCNFMICTGTWACSKLKSEAAKMIIIFWVILAFVGTGYEHCVANAGLFAMAFLAPQAVPEVSLIGAINNMIPVTLGNIAGGSLLVGWVYWFSGKN